MMNFYLLNNMNLVLVKETNSFGLLVLTLKRMRTMVGNEEILNHLQYQILSSVLLSLRYRETIKEALKTENFSSLLINIINKQLSLQNAKLLSVCISILRLIIYSGHESMLDLVKQVPILEALLEKTLTVLVQNKDDQNSE